MAILRNLDSRFSQAPMELDLPRSRFDRSCDHKTTFNAGDLVPIFWDEILPGDTFDMQTAYTCRMSTPIFPVMDNAYLETFFFFVPSRLIWSHWKEFNGENNSTYWTAPTEYNVPQISFPGGGFAAHTVADYMGLPTNVGSFNLNNDFTEATVSALPFRAYVKCWNDWFRDQNSQAPAYLPTDDSDRVGSSPFPNLDFMGELEDARLHAHTGGSCLKVTKYFDYFTSALPETQKGEPAQVNADFSSEIRVPVGTFPMNHDLAYEGLRFRGNQINEESLYSQFPLGVYVGDNSAGSIEGYANTGTMAGATFDEGYEGGVWPINLYAQGDIAGKFNLLVNDIRLAFQIQKLLEKDARSGTRYIEVLKAHFGVDSPDGRLQRSEYLGGSRQPINISQVLQTSSTDETSPLGSTAAYSLTNSVDNSFIKSFTEHGYIIGVACVRTDHTYQQGINRLWSRKRRFDYYWPSLAHIGEQAILKKELCYSEKVDPEEVFGYQEAWAEYRYKPSYVTGSFRSNYNGSLDAWHYADYYDPLESSDISLNEDFLVENPFNVDRTLAVQSSEEPQFIADFYFKCNATRVMPLYSVPGLVDHY